MIRIYITNLSQQTNKEIKQYNNNIIVSVRYKLVKSNSPANCRAEIGEGMKSADAKRRQIIIISRLAFMILVSS